MVTAPLILLIAVATTPDGVAVTNEAAAACLQELPAGAKTVVRIVSAVPDEATIGTAASAAGAAASVLVSWRDAARLVSDVRVFVASAADGHERRSDRTIVFSSRDLPAERGRALGLVIASILNDDWGIGPDSGGGGAQGPRGGSVDAEFPQALATARSAVPEVAPHWALEANVITAVDEQEDFDDALGGMVALRRSVTSHLALRVGVGFRVADLDGVVATARTTLGALGVAWNSDGFTRSGRFGFGARADLLGVHQSLKRNTGDDDAHEAGLWSLGGDLLGEVGLGLSSAISLILSAGIEGTLSSPSLPEPGKAPATIPRARLVFEIGVLSRF
jgi:hypothetical protein